MCGIFGIINYNESAFIDKNKVKNSAQLLKHRGPDAYGQWGIKDKIELAHVRLSIIDLNPESNQPFFSNCGNFLIIFNGEIYNYLEIRSTLEAKGYCFRTNSDTEVLLNSYIEWREECVGRFNGDWAFAIYDIKENCLFCSRDRFGVKPFNYSIIDGCFIFSSEIKSIISYFPQLKKPNYNVIANFCLSSVGAQIEDTWFENVKRLMPAHNFVIKNGKIKISRYWDYPKETNYKIKFNDAVERYQELFFNAVKLRMRSDVPVGTTLSSGLDSASIVSVLRKLNSKEHNTFTAVFKSDEYNKLEKSAYSTDICIDESAMVNRLSNELNLNSHLIPISGTQFCKDLSNAIYFLESGHSSAATIPLTKVMSVAKKYVSVVLEGQGADELLSGYVQGTFTSLILELLRRGKISQARNEFQKFRETYSLGYALKQFIRLKNIDYLERIYSWASGKDKVFGPRLKNHIKIPDYPFDPKGFNERFNKELFKLHSGVLVSLLHYGDAISLSKSVESRLPFMDVDLVEFSFKLPYYYKMHNGLGKYIHRQAMNNIVPQFVLQNPVKFGFNTPISQHFQSIDSEANKILLSDVCLARNIFDKKGITQFIKNHIDGKKNNSTVLFRLLSVELWFRMFID